MSKFTDRYFNEEPEMRERFIGYIKNKDIKTFTEFKDELDKVFDTKQGREALKTFDEQDYKTLWNSNEAKALLPFKQEIAEEKQEKLIVESARPVFTSYTGAYVKQGRTIKGYTRQSPRKFTPAQAKFIEMRKVKGVKPSQTRKEFNEYFRAERSQSSITTKYYRT